MNIQGVGVNGVKRTICNDLLLAGDLEGGGGKKLVT